MDHSDPLERATQPREQGETWDDDQFRDAREKDLRERTAAISSAVISALTCLLLAALLTSGKIVEIAERQELGATRDRQVSVAEKVDRAANFLSLNRPYDWIQDIRGAGEDAGERIDSVDEVVDNANDDGGGGADALVADDGPSAVDVAEAPATTSTTTVSPFPIRSVTDAAPLIVYVAGDSQATFLGQAITTESEGRALDVSVEDRISTSLARPDYFNWPAEFAAISESVAPEAVVLFLGANEHQDMANDDGTVFSRGSPEWQDEWSRRLGLSFDLLAGNGRHVFWVTQPPMRDGDLDEGIEMINALAAAVIAERDFVSSVDIYDLFGGGSGFSERVMWNGDEIRARVDDGVHLTRDAASWVADLAFAELDEVWDFS